MITLDPSAELPNALMIEKAVLSVLIKHPEKLDEAPALGKSHFYDPGRSEIFELISETIRTNGPKQLDLVSIVTELAATGSLAKLGGATAFSELMTFQPTPFHFDGHVKILNEYLARRLTISAALGMAEAAFHSQDIGEVMEAAGGPVTAIHDAIGEQKPPTSTKQLVKSSLQRYLDRANGISQPRGEDTGIAEIDQSLRGSYPGRMWVIGAYPSGGKSVIAGQILTRMAINGNPALFLTLEMSEDDLMDRCMIQCSQTPADAFVDPKGFAAMHDKEGPTLAIKRALNWSAEKLLTSPFLIRKPNGRSLRAVLACIRKAHREIGVKVCAIDYVQLIHVHGTSNNKEQEVSEISHSIQELAHELRMHIIVLTQLNADGDTKHGRVIEEDADAFLQIVQDMNKASDTFKEHQCVLIAKDRHFGQSGRKLPLIFDKTNIRFVHGVVKAPAKPLKRANF